MKKIRGVKVYQVVYLVQILTKRENKQIKVSWIIVVVKEEVAFIKKVWDMPISVKKVTFKY